MPTKQNKDGKWNWMLTVLLILVISFLVSSIVYDFKEREGKSFQPWLLKENVGYQFCSHSLISKGYLCDYDNTIYQLYNITEERMIEILKKCPDGKIIDSEYCIGNYVTIKNPKEYLEK